MCTSHFNISDHSRMCVYAVQWQIHYATQWTIFDGLPELHRLTEGMSAANNIDIILQWVSAFHTFSVPPSPIVFVYSQQKRRQNIFIWMQDKSCQFKTKSPGVFDWITPHVHYVCPHHCSSLWCVASSAVETQNRKSRCCFLVADRNYDLMKLRKHNVP